MKPFAVVYYTLSSRHGDEWVFFLYKDLRPPLYCRRDRPVTTVQVSKGWQKLYTSGAYTHHDPAPFCDTLPPHLQDQVGWNPVEDLDVGDDEGA